MPEGAKRIATYRVKWSVSDRKEYSIDSGCAGPRAVQAEGSAPAVPRWLALELSGYARIDLRLDEALQRVDY